MVTMFAISRSAAFRVAVDQAGGALTWFRQSFRARGADHGCADDQYAGALMVAISDRHAESRTTLARHLQARNVPQPA